ncbi:MAG: pantoate--beta-alanine ligase [bacterium]
MKVIDTVSALRQYRHGVTVEQSVAFVPTMGALHEGHLALIKAAVASSAVVIVSLFVNPSQFAPDEDYDAYPRDLDRDLALLEPLGVAVVFVPSVKDIYPDEFSEQLRVSVGRLGAVFCGISRPHFFSGVCSVLLRFFHLVQPNRVFMGEKDYQQCVVVKRLCEALFLDIELVLCSTFRAEDGLALSSRNQYLSVSERKEAALIYRMFCLAQEFFDGSDTNAGRCLEIMRNYLMKHSSFRIDYLDFVDPYTLCPRMDLDDEGRFLFAGYLGTTRLIDNWRLRG